MARRGLQLSLPTPPTWGGRRPGAGRKPTPGRRPGVPHRTRPQHRPAHPVHVTLRTADAVHCLRAGRVFPAVRRALAVSSHSGFRIIHYSVQNDHIHLIIEADDGVRLSAGVRGLAIRLARAINRALGRRGSVWDDRYRARDAAGCPECTRLRFNELQEASDGCGRNRPVLVGGMVRRLAKSARGARATMVFTRGPRAIVAGHGGMAPTWPH